MSKDLFTDVLLKWNQSNTRKMPWKGEQDPYLIWLSEIILQQTRVAQGWEYYNNFKERFPDVCSLAEAEEDEVMKLWQGLGYYSRARNLHATAKRICDEFKGKFPSSYTDILSLKGVGPYTAAAISSFAFELPYAVVDGNVIRILARYFGIDTPFDTTKGKKEFEELAGTLIAEKHPAAYNQAIMDFGATVCTPQQPNCATCPFSDHCYAKQHNIQDLLPVKSKKLVRKDRFFYYFIVSVGENYWIEKRSGKDIWRNLYQFPLIEKMERTAPEVVAKEHDLVRNNKCEITSISKEYSQLLTHQKIHAYFIEVKSSQALSDSDMDFTLVSHSDLRKFAYPKIINCYLENKLIDLVIDFPMNS